MTIANSGQQRKLYVCCFNPLCPSGVCGKGLSKALIVLQKHLSTWGGTDSVSNLPPVSVFPPAFSAVTFPRATVATVAAWRQLTRRERRESSRAVVRGSRRGEGSWSKMETASTAHRSC